MSKPSWAVRNRHRVSRIGFHLTAIIVAIVAFSACSSGGDAETPVPTQSLIEFTPSPSPVAMTPTPSFTPPPAAADLLATRTPAAALDADIADRLAAFAVVDLAAQMGVSQAALTVIQVENVEWSGTRLDCEAVANPRSQPRFEGYRVLLLLQNTVYTYHTDDVEFVLRCAETPVDEVAPDVRVLIDPVAADLVALVRTSLAQRLDLPQRRIVLSELEAVTWQDNSLGCPAEGIPYTPDPLPGYRIVMTAGEQTYTYHTDFIQAIPCDR